MKGGITSGVIYPLAACELAKSYQFRRVGGTSAGAIAAAATAAAEYGRRHGTGCGFVGLAQLPVWLGSPSAAHKRWPNLLALFQPQRETGALFNLLLAVLKTQNAHPVWRTIRFAGALLRGAPGSAVLGAVPGALLLGALAPLLAVGGPTAWSGGGGMTLAALGTLGGALVAAAGATVLRALRTLPRNHYGICSGYHAPGVTPQTPPLTAWLTDFLNRLAGKPEEKPLTFGDLRAGCDGPSTGIPPSDWQIDLQMITTCLSHGRPYRLPFEERSFYFDPDELKVLFPPAVVKWMLDHPCPGVETEIQGKVELGRLRPMPAPDDLPVVVATRMSLSFPLLISAVPLYAVDFRRSGEADGLRRPERCWFSDGGLSSNFPVHLFDAPLPRWPIFALNLSPFPFGVGRDLIDETKNVTMPDTNRSGIQVRWQRWEEMAENGRTAGGSVGGFIGALVNALQNWTDNMQIPVPGWRDRIAHVFLEATEGGLNLSMPAAEINSLSARGQAAASLLASRYLRAPEKDKISWDNHRWVRFRSTMMMLQRLLRDMHARLGDRSAPGLDQTLFDAAQAGTVISYDWPSAKGRELALEAVKDLMDLVAAWESKGVAFDKGAPEFPLSLRITPRV